MGKNRYSKILYLKGGRCFRRHAKEYTVRIWDHGKGHNLGRTYTRLVLRESWAFLRYMGPKKGTPHLSCLSPSHLLGGEQDRWKAKVLSFPLNPTTD